MTLEERLDKFADDITFKFVADRDDLKEVEDYVSQFSGGEAVAATVVFHMTMNTVAKMLRNMMKDENYYASNS